MAETAAALNYAKEYSNALANAYPDVLHFGALYNVGNDSRYTWLNGNTVYIPTMSTSGCVDADRDSIEFAKRNHTNKFTAKTLSFERKWSTILHDRDIAETDHVTTIVNVTKTFNETQKFPEKDSYLVSKIYADFVEADGVVDYTAPTKDNVLALFDKYMEEMDEANVPQTGRKFYCTYAIKTLLKQSAQITRHWDTQVSGTAMNRKVDYLDGVEIIGVPSKIMKTAFNFTVGCKPALGAKQINMFAVHVDAIITPETYEFARLDSPSACSEGKWVYYEERHEDAFILDERIGGIKFNVTNASI